MMSCELLGVAGGDAAEQVARAARRVRLEDLRHRLEVRDRLGQAALGDLEEHEREHRVAQARRVDLGPEAADDAAVAELAQARLHGAARDAEAARGLHQADTRLGGQQLDEARVELVDRTGHSAQNLARCTARCCAS